MLLDWKSTERIASDAWSTCDKAWRRTGRLRCAKRSTATWTIASIEWRTTVCSYTNSATGIDAVRSVSATWRTAARRIYGAIVVMRPEIESLFRKMIMDHLYIFDFLFSYSYSPLSLTLLAKRLLYSIISHFLDSFIIIIIYIFKVFILIFLFLSIDLKEKRFIFLITFEINFWKIYFESTNKREL